MDMDEKSKIERRAVNRFMSEIVGYAAIMSGISAIGLILDMLANIADHRANKPGEGHWLFWLIIVAFGCGGFWWLLRKEYNRE